MKVAIVGQGKVGRSLARAARTARTVGAAGVVVQSHPARGALAPLDVDLVVIAARDEAIGRVAAKVATAGAVVHCAGALGPEVLAPLRRQGIAVGVMHPAISMVDDTAIAGTVVLSGDPSAVARARTFAERLGLAAVVADEVDRPLYHAAMALAANGAAALVASAERLAIAAGLDRDEARKVLGPLLVSVGHNVARLGAEAALSGPVRRGSVATVRAHLDRIAALAPDQLPLYRAMVRAQLPLARQIGEASEGDLDAIAALVR